MIAEITTGIESLKAATDLLKLVNATATQAQINEAKIGLQQSLLDAQRALFAAQHTEAATADRIRDLENQIVQLKNWEREKERYELKAIYVGAFAYVPKPGMDQGEPPHWLCAHCFANGEKRFLQSTGVTRAVSSGGINAWWECGSCHNSVVVFFRITPSSPWTPQRASAT